jgi:hypothetical protein
MISSFLLRRQGRNDLGQDGGMVDSVGLVGISAIWVLEIGLEGSLDLVLLVAQRIRQIR